MDELIAFIDERLTDHDLEIRLNPDSGLFSTPLMGFINGMRAVLAEYRDMQSCMAADTSGKLDRFCDGYMRAMEDAIRRIAVHIWGVALPHSGFKPEWEHGAS